MSFKEYQFKDYINEALAAINFKEPTEVQKLVIPRALKGEQVVVESATGSGKTHSFLLPIFERIDESVKEVQAVIISPTRELAQQLFNVASTIAEKNTAIDVRLAIGGTNRDSEIKRLNASQPQIVIGTLGRIQDLVIQTNVLKIYNAKMVVIDEADMVINEKDLADVDKVLGVIQNKPQFLVFSATMPKHLRQFVNKYLSGVAEIVLSEENLTTSNIEHIMIPCKAKQREVVLEELLQIINPYLALIFVNTKDGVEELADYLANHNYRVAKIHGDLDDRARKQILRRIHDLQYQYVVASDIASRGIDIEGVSHVINFDLPKDVEFYIHRTGRTARHDAKGTAYSLYPYEGEEYVNLLKEKGLKPKFMKIVDGELKEIKLVTKKTTNPIKLKEIELHTKIKLPSKVKPGYKKKRMAKINDELRKAKRSRIEEIYRKKKHDENR